MNHSNQSKRTVPVANVRIFGLRIMSTSAATRRTNGETQWVTQKLRGVLWIQIHSSKQPTCMLSETCWCRCTERKRSRFLILQQTGIIVSLLCDHISLINITYSTSIGHILMVQPFFVNVPTLYYLRKTTNIFCFHWKHQCETMVQENEIWILQIFYSLHR